MTLPIHNLTQSSRRAAGQRSEHKRYGRWRDGMSDNIHGKFVINITKRFHHLFNDLDSNLENLENSFHMSTLTHSLHQPHGFLFSCKHNQGDRQVAELLSTVTD